MDNVKIFCESIAKLGLNKHQFESVMAVFEDVFHHANAKFLYVKNDNPNVIYTIRGLEDEYNASSQLVKRFTYWLHNEIGNGYILVLRTKEDLKEYLFANKDLYYSSIMFDEDLEGITSPMDFSVRLKHIGNDVDDKITVVSNVTGHELFNIGLRTGNGSQVTNLYTERVG